MDETKLTSDEKRERLARDVVRRISDAAIELAFTRHELTTTNYEEEEHADVEEGVEAFKVLVEAVKTDVLACLTGDETGCLDPEDIDYDNELRYVERVLATPAPQWQQDIRREDGRCVPGIYWQRRLSNHALQIVEINHNGMIWRVGASNTKTVIELRETCDYEWQGPIAPATAGG